MKRILDGNVTYEGMEFLFLCSKGGREVMRRCFGMIYNDNNEKKARKQTNNCQTLSGANKLLNQLIQHSCFVNNFITNEQTTTTTNANIFANFPRFVYISHFANEFH